MSDFDPVDQWFESGFRIRRQATRSGQKSISRIVIRDKSRSKGGSPPLRGKVNISAGAKSRNVIKTIRNAPQVMVKITGNSSGMKQVKHHLDYISRNGDVELINELGESIHGKVNLKDYKEELKASQVPEESKRREFIHVILSMPEGTDKVAFKQSLIDFAKEEFSNRQYVIAIHDDTDHVHAHINVNTRDIDRADEPRLNPRKADLQRWRQGFADKLNDNGIEATASYRTARFNYRRPEKAAIRQIRSDNPESSVFNKKRAAKKGLVDKPRVPRIYQNLSKEIEEAVKRKIRPTNPAIENIEKSREIVLEAWHKVVANLEKSNNQDLANEVRNFIKLGGDSVTTSRNQEEYDSSIEFLKEAHHSNRNNDEIEI